MGTLLIFLSVCTGMAESMLIKKYNSSHESGGFFFTALVSLFSMLFFVVSNRDGFAFPGALWGYAVCAGVCYCAASFLTYMALEWGSFAVSMLLLSYSGIVFSSVYGIVFLKEKVTALSAVGLVLILASVYLSRNAPDETKKKVSLKWVAAISVSCAGSGLFTVIKRMQQIRFSQACDHEFMIAALGLSAAALLLAELIRSRKSGGLALSCVPYAVGAGVSNGLNNLLGLLVTVMMPISIVSPVRAGVQIVFYFAAGALVFKEKFLKRQVAGAALGLLAVILLNL